MKKDIIDILKRAMPFGVVCAISALLSWRFYSIDENIALSITMVSFLTGFYFLVYILFIIMRINYSVAGLVGKIAGKISRKRFVLDKIDFEKNKEYYREILKENTPLILGYLDDFELDTNKIIAELLYLQKEKVIELGNGRVENKNFGESLKLKPSEKIFLNKILVGKLRINDFNNFLLEFKNIVAKDAEKLLLINEFAIKNKNILPNIIILFWLIISVVLGIGIANLINYFIGGLDIGLIRILFGLSSIFLMLSTIVSFEDSYIKNKGKLYKRTAKGRELNQKLEGLKNYLKDYSLMDEREAKEIELWDDYLIYSVMFGQNKKIIEEYEKYIEIIE